MPDSQQLTNQSAAMFKALGDPTRLRIFQFLLARCCMQEEGFGVAQEVAVEDSGAVRPVDGPTVGAVCCHLTGRETVTSTISEHLKELRIAGLITMEKRGRYVICGVCEEAVDSLAILLSRPTGAHENRDSCC